MHCCKAWPKSKRSVIWLQLPEGSLLRNKAWKDLEPLVKEELDKYGDALGQALVRGDSEAAPDMRDYAVREFEHGGADLPERSGFVINRCLIASSLR